MIKTPPKILPISSTFGFHLCLFDRMTLWWKPDDIADRVREIVKASMEQAFKPIFPEVPFVVEPPVAEAWG